MVSVGSAVHPPPPLNSLLFIFHFSESFNTPMDFSRGRPMLCPPIVALLGAVVFIAIMPTAGHTLNCWSGAINNSGIESTADVFVIKQCKPTDQICTRGTCLSVDQNISLVALSCYNNKEYLIRVGCGKFEALQNEGSNIRWSCKCEAGDINENLYFLPPPVKGSGSTNVLVSFTMIISTIIIIFL